MKFGDTLYQRSVPKWAAYNVNYNGIKRVIKERTSSGLAVPVTIPQGSSANRWAPLEDELFSILKEQHANIVLFLKSKDGEIDRRLASLEKQVKSAQKAAQRPYSNTSLPKRRFHKCVEEVEAIGEDIQNLTRFASVQKTAFRKLLKKYRKWTGSTSLQNRFDNEVLATGQLNLEYAESLQRLTALSKLISDQAQRPRLESLSTKRNQTRIDSPTQQSSSTVSGITVAEKEGPIALDAALTTIPFGASSGIATYWIHPDNIDEAQALLLRHVREVHKPNPLSRQGSGLSIDSGQSHPQLTNRTADRTHIVYFDNLQRFCQDESKVKPSKVALTGRWCRDPEAVITMFNLAIGGSSNAVVKIKKKDIAKAFDRQDTSSVVNQKRYANSENICKIQEYLSEHRDVKPLGKLTTTRTRFAGTSNSSQAGSWATLDVDVMLSTIDAYDSNLTNEDTVDGMVFPHAILCVRWEFGHTPEVVRAFDNTHLAERVEHFTLESATVHMVNSELDAPGWKDLLKEDIRKVPISTKVSSARRRSFSRSSGPATGTSSGPSSTDDPSDAVFSAPENVHSSATSLLSPEVSASEPSSPTTSRPERGTPGRKKKRARFDAQSPPPPTTRYWNEFDDGDEDVNPQEAYMIYVDPDERLPGAEAVSKAFGAMCRSLEGASSRISSMLSWESQPKRGKKDRTGEHSGLLSRSSTSNTEDWESSDSDTTPTQAHSPNFGTFTFSRSQPRSVSDASRTVHSSVYRPNQVLTPRQQALERNYFITYVGLLVLSYTMLFISGVLLSTGRKRAYIEVDIAAIVGIATAETCAVLSILVLWMTRSSLGLLQRGIIGFAIVGILLIGIGEIVVLIRRPVTRH